jgi:hypothetical protein
MRKKKDIISNTGNIVCFNINVYNLYINDVIIYENKKKVVRTAFFVNKFT